MDFNNAILAYRGLGQAATNLNGIFRFEDDALFFDNLTGTIAQSPIQVNGSFLIDENIDIILTSNRLNLAGVKNLIANSPILSEIQEILRDFTLLNGFSQAQLSLSGNPNANFFDNLRLNSITGSFIHALAGFPVDILSGNLLITQNIISTDKINARALGSPIIVSGQVSGLEQELIPRLNIAVQNFNFARFPELVQAPIVTNDIRRFIGDFSDFSGQMDVNINLLPNTFRVLIQPERVYALYQPANVDLELHSGNIAITPENIEFSPLYGIISDSPLYVDGLARNYQNAPVLNLVASAKIAPQDIEEYINPLLDEPITVQGIIPIAVSAQGELNDWKILAQATLEKGANVFIRSDIGLPQDKIRVFSLNAQGNTDMIRVNNLELATGDDIIEVGTSASPNPEKVTELRRLIGAYGAINEIQSESPEFENFYIETPNPVNITLLNPAIQAETPFFTEGEMRFKALLNGDVSNPDTTGSAVVENVSIPSRDTFIEFARARLDENALILDESSINIADSSMNINAIASRNFERPFTIRQIIINASMFNIDSIIEALSQPETAEQEEQTPFIIVERGSIEAEELILGDLLAANVRSCFNLSPIGYLPCLICLCK
ncbi:MAG: hypothetical protein MZU97_26795 [Bacillus subtilis]|nr:hypothetical protein [Bacillus subtilis]